MKVWLTTFLFFVLGVSNIYANENWECSEEISGHRQTLNDRRCQDRSAPWACFEKVREVCVEKSSKRTVTKNFERFWGCGQLNDCQF